MNRKSKLLASKPESLNSLSHLAGGLRRTVTARLMRDFGLRLPPPLIRRVLNEASEIAEETGFPNLFFPALAEEKARFVTAALSDDHLEHASRDLRHAA